MRCPECQQRNSVAARKCKFCGARFKRKEMSSGKKIAILAFFGVIGAAIYLSISLPKMVDPSEQLTNAAKRIAGGPKSSEDAKTNKANFEEAAKNLLKKFGNDNSGMLSKRLKACLLPTEAFEVLVVDLPKGLKLVEIDTVLQATDFLLMKGNNDIKVFPLPNFEVYDDARAVNDESGTVIVLLGHTSGQPPHKPIIQTLAMLPDSVMDETASMVPAIAGEGSAKFDKSSNDVNVELAMPSVAQSEKINVTPPLTPERTLRTRLQWKQAKFVPSSEIQSDLPTNLMLLARTLKHQEYAASMAAVLGPEANKLIKDNAAADMQDVTISPSKSDSKHRDSEKEAFYSISNAKKRIDLVLKKSSGNWQLASYSISNLAPAAGSAEKKDTAGGDDKNATAKNDKGQTPSAITSAGETLAPKHESDTRLSNNSGAEHGNKNNAQDKKNSELEAKQGGPSNVASSTNSNLKSSLPGDNSKNSTNNSKTMDSRGNSATTNGKAESTEGSPIQKKQSNPNDILGGLTPEVAGAHPKPVVTKPSNKSSWLDDDKQNEVAMVPTSQKGNGQGKSKTDNAKDLKDQQDKKDQKDKKDKKDKQRADEERASKDKAAKEQANKSDGDESAASSSGKISETLGTSTVRLRSGPGLNSHTLDEIPKGTKVQIIGKKNGWYKVAYSGKTGYVFSPLVETKSSAGDNNSKSSSKSAKNKENFARPETSKSETARENKTKEDNETKTEASASSGNASGVVVHVMTLRDEHKKAISSVKVGERVVVLSGLKNNRYKIRKPDGTVGYVAKEALDVKVETPPEFVP